MGSDVITNSNCDHCPASCATLQHSTSLSFSALSSKAAEAILSTHSGGIKTDFRAAVAIEGRAEEVALHATLHAMQTMLLNTKQMQQTLNVDFIDPGTSIIDRVNKGLAAIMALAKKDIQDPMSTALDTANNMYNVFAKPNIETITSEVEKQKSVLREIANIIQTFQLRQGKQYFAFHEFELYCKAATLGDILTGQQFYKLHHYLVEANTGFAELNIKLDSALVFYHVMRSVDSWNYYLQKCHNEENLSHKYLPQHQLIDGNKWICSDPISAMLEYNKEFAQALSNFTNAIGLVEGIGKQDMIALAGMFYPLWNQFENTTGSLVNCLLDYPALVERLNTWITGFDLDLQVDQVFERRGIIPEVKSIEEFSEQFEKRYNKYMLQTETKEEILYWFQSRKTGFYASLDNLRFQISQTLFTPLSIKLSETELLLSQLYSEGLYNILTLSSYYNTTYTDVFRNISLTADIWRKPQAQIDSASVLTFDLDLQEAISLAESSIVEYSKVKEQQRSYRFDTLSSSTFTPILSSYFQGMQARLQLIEDKLFTDILNAQDSMDSLDQLMAMAQAQISVDKDFIR